MTPPYKLDTTEQLVWDSESSAAVLGSADGFLLILLDGLLPHASLEFATVRGYFYCGVLCVVNGSMEIEGPEEIECRRLLLRAAVPFAEYIAAKAPKDDSAEWCANLWKLEDPRA
jgi:hypothetical protein